MRHGHGARVSEPAATRDTRGTWHVTRGRVTEPVVLHRDLARHAASPGLALASCRQQPLLVLEIFVEPVPLLARVLREDRGRGAAGLRPRPGGGLRGGEDGGLVGPLVAGGVQVAGHIRGELLGLADHVAVQ